MHACTHASPLPCPSCPLCPDTPYPALPASPCRGSLDEMPTATHPRDRATGLRGSETAVAASLRLCNSRLADSRSTGVWEAGFGPLRQLGNQMPVVMHLAERSASLAPAILAGLLSHRAVPLANHARLQILISNSTKLSITSLLFPPTRIRSALSKTSTASFPLPWRHE